MDVLIVVPPLVPQDDTGDDASPDFERRRLVSPAEPLTVAADLRRHGHRVRLFDIGVFGPEWKTALLRRLRDDPPEVVAAVQSILTFATAQDWDGAELFDLVRAIQPDVVTVLTGAEPTNKPGRAVAAGICDYSVRGEVDLVLSELLAAVSSGRAPDDVAGVSWRDDKGAVHGAPDYPAVDLADLPMPAYDLLDADHRDAYARVLERGKIRYPEKSPRYRDIMTSRSCVLRCSYCSVAHLRGPRQKYRRKSLERILDEVEQALEQGIEEIHFFDDLFASEEAQIFAFTEAIARRNLRFPWFVAQGMPLWPLSRDALAAMAETGMYRIICPFESGNDRVLREVAGKIHSSVAHHSDVARWAREAGLEVIGMFVVGMPGESRAEILDTIAFAEEHPEIDYNVFSIATPMEGTRMMNKLRQSGRFDDKEVLDKVIKRTVALYRTEHFTEVELGVIRCFDWDRINFSDPARRRRYARMVGVSEAELDHMRAHSRASFERFFPGYDGPKSFRELFAEPERFAETVPVIPDRLY